MKPLQSLVAVSMVVTLAAGLLLGIGVAAQAPSSPSEVRALVTIAIENAVSETGIAVDPRVVEDFTASAVIFSGNFCYPSSSPEGKTRCEMSLQNPAVLGREVRDLLQTIREQRPATIEVLGSRLARAIGLEMAMADFPSRANNMYGVVEIPADVRGATITLLQPMGSRLLGSNLRAIVLTPGRSELLVRLPNGAEQRSVANVAVRSATQLALSGGTPRPTTANASGRIEPTGDLFCYGSGGTSFDGELAMFNWGRATFGEQESEKERNRAPITRQHVVEVAVDDQTGRCDALCQQSVGIAFAQAIAVWRTGCARCDPNALSILKVGANVWIDSRIAGRIRAIQANPRASVNLDLRVKDVSEQLTTIAAPSLSIPEVAIVAYEQLTGDRNLSAAMCSLSPGGAPWANAALRTICNRNESLPPGNITPTMRIVPGATSCGPSRDFIACGKPGGSVELSVDNIRYAVPVTAGKFEFGAGSISVDLRHVVLHEVGHWFGVPHVDTVAGGAYKDVMTSVPEDGKPCVSAASLIMLNNATDLRWKYRVLEGGGLRRPRQSAQQMQQLRGR